VKILNNIDEITYMLYLLGQTSNELTVVDAKKGFLLFHYYFDKNCTH
jgi:hypothetical protein